jgi:hypothetical protein
MPRTDSHSFTRRPLCLALTVVSACIGLTALAVEPSGPLILTPEEIHHTRNDIGGTVGNALVVGPRKIDKLGVFDAGGDGLATVHEVGIWEMGTGKRVVSATVPAGTEGELIEGFRYVKLPEPVELKGGLYRIGALFVKGGDPFPDSEGYAGVFLGADDVRLDDSVYTPGETLAPPTSGAPGGDPGIWTRAARWAAANAYTTPRENAEPKAAAGPLDLPPVVRLAAQLAGNHGGVFQPGQPVEVLVEITGRRLDARKIQWAVTDWKDAVVGRGEIAAPLQDEAKFPGIYSATYAKEWDEFQASRPKVQVPPWRTTLKLPDYGPGYFALNMRLARADGRTSPNDPVLPAFGNRPAGLLTYAVLPKITALPLEHVDDSRFGLCGEANLLSGELHGGNTVDPLYPLVGARWIYKHRRMADMRLDRSYPPTPAASAKLWHDESNAGLSLLLSCIGIPAHMQAAPDGVTGFGGEAHPPKDFAGWGRIIGNFALEQAQVRQAGLFPKQRYNYYEITWEPDWGYKGSDADFIKMFKTAREAIRANDPNGKLLGPKYGVLPRGIRHLERLLPMGLGRQLDGLTTHSYGSWPDRVLARDARKLVALAKQYLPPDAKRMVTELEGSFLYPKPFTKAQEAAATLRGHLIWLGEGFDATWFFVINNLFYDLTGDLTYMSPTPSFSAFAALTRLLEGTKTIGPVDYLGDEIKAYAFDRAGQTLIALWAADDAGSCAEPVRPVNIPVGPGEVIFYDPVGRATPLAGKDGYVTVAVGAQPVFLLGAPAAVAPVARVELRPGESFPADALDGDGSFILFRGGKELALGGAKSLPRDIGPGDWLLLQKGTKDGSLLAGRAVSVAAPLSVEELPADPRRPDARTLRLANTWDEAVRGRVDIYPAMDRYGHNTSEKWQVIAPGAAPLQSREIKLAAGKTREIKFDLSATSGAKPGQSANLVAQFSDPFGRAARADMRPLKSAPRRVMVGRAAAAPAVSGDLRPWILELFQSFASGDDVGAGRKDWQGPEDLSFRLAAQYDDKALYLAVKVRDQSHVHEGGNPWRNAWGEDSIQINLALHPVPEGTAEGANVPGLNTSPARLGYAFFQEFCFALKNGVEPVAYRFEAPTPIKTGPLDLQAVEGVRFAAKRVGDETHYEIAIPWKELDPKLSGAPAEKGVGFGIVVNDMDIEKGFKAERKAMNPVGAFGPSPELGVLALE